MRKTLCLGMWICCIGLLFSQAGCRTVPRWDWWRVGNRGPSDSSALARSATELPSTIASRAGGSGKANGDIAPPFNPSAEMLAGTTPSTDGPASTNTKPISSASLATAAPIDMTPQQGPYDTNRFAASVPNSVPNNSPANNVAELPQYNAIENSVGAYALAGKSTIPSIPAAAPTYIATPGNRANAALVANSNQRNSAIPTTGLPAYGMENINQLRQAQTNLAGAAKGVRSEVENTANSIGNELVNAGTTARNNIASAAANAINNVADNVRVATATPSAYRPGGTGNYSTAMPAVFNIATRPSGATTAPVPTGTRQ